MNGRYGRQPAPVLDTAVRLLAALLHESAVKRDERGAR